MSDKNKQETVFGPDPELLRAIASAKSTKVPIGGVTMPTMPRLDQPPPNPSAGAQTVRAAQRVLSPTEQQQLAEQGRFISGVGSAYAANQPNVHMSGQLPTDTEGNERPIDPRVAPRPPGSGLRQDTIQHLEAVAAANSSNDTELNKIKEEIEAEEDSFEENEFGERVRSLLSNKKRKDLIEARCPSISFEDLLMNGFVTQKVPIIPGKFEPVFRSLYGEENEEILRLMGSIRGPNQYILDVLTLFNLTAGLYGIGTKVLPNHIDSKGDFNEEMFRAKHKVVRKMALPILADLSVNFRWFTKRVQKLTVIDEIKGF